MIPKTLEQNVSWSRINQSSERTSTMQTGLWGPDRMYPKCRLLALWKGWIASHPRRLKLEDPELNGEGIDHHQTVGLLREVWWSWRFLDIGVLKHRLGPVIYDRFVIQIKQGTFDSRGEWSVRHVVGMNFCSQISMNTIDVNATVAWLSSIIPNKIYMHSQLYAF